MVNYTIKLETIEGLKNHPPPPPSKLENTTNIGVNPSYQDQSLIVY
jgi:hypothetical protein